MAGARPGGPGQDSKAGEERGAPGLSACVIARDEEDRIDACLESLGFCDELLVVDAHSRDDTRRRAAARGARVLERDWPGYGPQKRFATGMARHDWVLCLDADERVSPELRREIEALRAGGFVGPGAWEMPRRSRYLGRWIRHGTWYPDPKLRLFDRRRGSWGGRDPHDRVSVRGPVGRLEGSLFHHPHRSFDAHIDTIHRYTTTMAEAMHAEGRRARLWDLVLRPPARFLDFYLIRSGWRDGWRGLLLAYLAAHYVRLKYAKLWILDHR